MKRKIFTGLFLVSALMANAQLPGSGCPTLLDEEQWLSGKLYTGTCNASGLSLDSLPELRHFEFFYNHRQGDFSTAAVADRSDFFGFKTFGFKKLDKVILAGSFDYDRTYDKKVDWYMRFDPSESNPFYIADSIGGDWLKDRFRTTFSLASRRSRNGFLAGMKTEYRVGLGGRDNDPRPESLWMNLNLYPSVTWSSPSGWFTGFTAIGGMKREDLNVMNRYGIGGNAIFKINGLMQFGQPLVKSSLSYRFDGLSAGAAIQGGYRSCTSSWFVELEYLNRIEHAVQSPYASDMNEETYEFTSTAIHDADYLEQSYKASGNLKILLGERTFVTNLGVSALSGKSYIFDNEQVEFVAKGLEIKWSGEIFNGAPNDIRSGIGADVFYRSSDALNYFYASRLISQAGFNLHYSRTLAFTGGWSLGLRLLSGASFDLGSSLLIAPETPFIPETTAITEALIVSDFEVLSAGYLTEALQAILYLPVTGHKRIYIKGSGEVLLPEAPWDALLEIHGSLGMLF